MSRVGSKGPGGWDTVEAALCGEPGVVRTSGVAQGMPSPTWEPAGGAAELSLALAL